MTLEATPERVIEISLLVQSWLRKKKASLKELQSLLDKLHFISACYNLNNLEHLIATPNRVLEWCF
jgi:hypothetical protein